MTLALTVDASQPAAACDLIPSIFSFNPANLTLISLITYEVYGVLTVLESSSTIHVTSGKNIFIFAAKKINKDITY